MCIGVELIRLKRRVGAS